MGSWIPNKKPLSFVAIFNDGSFVEQKEFSLIRSFENVFVFLEKEHIDYHVTISNNEYDYFKYNLIGSDGKATKLCFDKFDLIEIGSEKRFYGSSSKMEMKLYDKQAKTIRSVNLDTYSGNLNIFKNTIMPLLDRINKYCSWESFLVEEENEKLKKEIEKLELTIKRLRESKE